MTASSTTGPGGAGDHRPGRIRRWLYRGGRPSRLAAALNRATVGLVALGVRPGQLVTLEVRGRRTGRRISFPLVLADHAGERYLVAMLGEGSAWVRNVRAAGGHAVLRARRSEAVHLLEVPVAERAPILRRYLQLAPGGRPHIPVDPQADLAEFEGVADRYPAFRVVPGPAPDAPRRHAP